MGRLRCIIGVVGVGLGGWPMSVTAAAHDSAVDAVLEGKIPWVTSHGVRPMTVSHEVWMDGDSVLDAPLDIEAPAPEPMAFGAHRAATFYLAMDGITLHPSCPAGQVAHSAFDCTRMVSNATAIPAVSSETTKAQIAQAVRDLLAPYDVAVTTTRPPPYLPYFVAAIGGENFWTENNFCGRAHIGCGAQYRNLIAVNFPESCNNIQSTIVHELGHNLGLEHTSFEPDLMFPAGGTFRSPQDICSNVNVTAPTPRCAAFHKLECPEGNGHAQNTHAQLMSRLGPRRHDVTPPTILEISPQESLYTTEDVITLSASIADEGRTVGVRWQWFAGLPDEYDAYEQCTNDVCELSFPPESYATNEYKFVTFTYPPPGEYSFRLDAIDAYGNKVTKLLAFRVEEPTENSEEEEEEEAEETGTVDDDFDLDEEAETDGEALPPSYGADLDADMGCSCRGSSPSSLLLFLLVPCFVVRKRLADIS